MLKQLEKRFDKKLHEQVLERLEAEFEKLQEALAKEKTEQVEPKQNETELQQEIETRTEPDEYTKSIETEEQGIEAIETKTEPEVEEAELPNEEGLHEIDNELGWLSEHDETKLPEISEENEAIELEEPGPESIETAETLADQEPIEQPAVEINEPLPTEVPIEEPVDLETEQLADLEPLLDQIEPIEPIEPIEALPEILPEALEEEPEVIEGEAY